VPVSVLGWFTHRKTVPTQALTTPSVE